MFVEVDNNSESQYSFDEESNYDDIHTIQSELDDIEEVEEEDEEPKFHMIAKKVFLTYSQANFLNFDILKERLIDNNVSIWVISQENHKLQEEEDEELDEEEDEELNEFDEEVDLTNQSESDFSESNQEFESESNNEDSAGIHFHVYLEFLVKIDIRDPYYFDLITTTNKGDEISYHPNIQYVRSKRACIIYIKKDGNWISNEESKYNEIQALNTKAEALKWIFDNGEISKSRFWLDVWENRDRKKIFDNRCNMPFFKWWKQIPLHNFETGFSNKGRPKALYLYGKPETGKTLWISQFLKDEPKFYVGDWKQFHLYRNERIIVFEDFMPENFKNMTGFFKSLITDTYISLYTPSYYTSHLINKERTVIFSSNINPKRSDFFDKALLSRLVVINSDYDTYDIECLTLRWENLMDKFQSSQAFHSYSKGILNTITEFKKNGLF